MKGNHMNTLLRDKCDAFLKHFRVLSEHEYFGSQQLILAMAGFYMSTGGEPDFARLKESEKILYESESIFSKLRGNGEFFIRAKMAMTNDPGYYLDQLKTVYELFRPGIIGDEQAIMEAMTIVDYASPTDYEAMVKKTDEVYKEMKRTHLFLTKEDDKPFAALMAVLGTDPKTTHARAEAAFKYLKDRFDDDKDTIQSLSHVISLTDGDLQDICARICTLAQKLRKAGIRFEGERRAAILGIFADTDISTDEISALITEADQYLAKHEPFSGPLGIERESRHLYAVQCAHASVPSSSSSIPAAVTSAIEFSALTDMAMRLIMNEYELKDIVAETVTDNQRI